MKGGIVERGLSGQDKSARKRVGRNKEGISELEAGLRERPERLLPKRGTRTQEKGEEKRFQQQRWEGDSGG